MSHPSVIAILLIIQLISALFIVGLVFRLHDARTKYKLAKLSWMEVNDSYRRIMSHLEDLSDDPGERIGRDYEDFVIGWLNKTAINAGELGRIEEVLKERNQTFPGASIADTVYSLCVTEQLVQKNWSIPMEIQPRSRAMLKAFFQKVADKYLKAQMNRLQRHEDAEAWMIREPRIWPVPECQMEVIRHIAKGDPVDVAIYCAFLSWHEEETSLMNYISVTPALEQLIKDTLIVRNIPEGTDLSKVTCVETKLQPSFKLEHVEGTFRIKPETIDQQRLREVCTECGYERGEHHSGDDLCPVSKTSMKWRETKFTKSKGGRMNLDAKCWNCDQRRGVHSAGDERCPLEPGEGYAETHFKGAPLV